MGYNITKSITITPTTINIKGSSSNTFEAVSRGGRMKRCEENGTVENTEANLRELWHELTGGALQPVRSANNYRWTYALQTCHTYEDFRAFIDSKQPTGKYAIRTTRPYSGYFRKYGRCFCSTQLLENATPMGFYEAHVIFNIYKGANDLELIKL